MLTDTPLVTRMESPSTGTRTPGPRGLPDDLLRESVRRLRVIAFIYAGGFFLGEGAFTLFDPQASTRSGLDETAVLNTSDLTI